MTNATIGQSTEEPFDQEEFEGWYDIERSFASSITDKQLEELMRRTFTDGNNSFDVRFYQSHEEMTEHRVTFPGYSEYEFVDGIFSSVEKKPLLSLGTVRRLPGDNSMNHGFLCRLGYLGKGYMQVKLNQVGEIESIEYDEPEPKEGGHEYKIIQDPKNPFKFIVVTPFSFHESSTRMSGEPFEQDVYMALILNLQWSSAFPSFLIGEELNYEDLLSKTAMSLKEFAELLERYRRIQQNRRFIQ